VLVLWERQTLMACGAVAGSDQNKVHHVLFLTWRTRVEECLSPFIDAGTQGEAVIREWRRWQQKGWRGQG